MESTRLWVETVTALWYGSGCPDFSSLGERFIFDSESFSPSYRGLRRAYNHGATRAGSRGSSGHSGHYSKAIFRWDTQWPDKVPSYVAPRPQSGMHGWLIRSRTYLDILLLLLRPLRLQYWAHSGKGLCFLQDQAFLSGLRSSVNMPPMSDESHPALCISHFSTIWSSKVLSANLYRLQMNKFGRKVVFCLYTRYLRDDKSSPLSRGECVQLQEANESLAEEQYR